MARLSTADARDIQPGEYMRTPEHVWYRCLGCGGTNPIPAHDYGIGTDGRVTPQYTCPDEMCGQPVWLVLENWSSFDVSDVESKR